KWGFHHASRRPKRASSAASASILPRSHPAGRNPSIIEPERVVIRSMVVSRSLSARRTGGCAPSVWSPQGVHTPRSPEEPKSPIQNRKSTEPVNPFFQVLLFFLARLVQREDSHRLRKCHPAIIPLPEE